MAVQSARSNTVPVETDEKSKFTCICYKCRAQFELSESQASQGGKGAECPECRSRDIQIVYAPSCSIDTPGEIKMLMWEYLCHNCRAQFELPVPRGPKEEKETECPNCGSKNIQRVMIELGTCPPGG